MWEYKVVEVIEFQKNTEGKLNELGKEGWELVGIVYATDKATPYYRFFFKRTL